MGDMSRVAGYGGLGIGLGDAIGDAVVDGSGVGSCCTFTPTGAAFARGAVSCMRVAAANRVAKIRAAIEFGCLMDGLCAAKNGDKRRKNPHRSD